MVAIMLTFIHNIIVILMNVIYLTPSIRNGLWLKNYNPMQELIELCEMCIYTKNIHMHQKQSKCTYAPKTIKNSNMTNLTSNIFVMSLE